MAQFSGIPAALPVAGSSARSTTQECPLGTVAYDKDGNEYRYVRAGAAIAAYDACVFEGSASGYDAIVPSSAVNENLVGIAGAAFADLEYGFIQTRGVATAKVIDATAAKSILVTSGTAGTLKLATEAESLAGAKNAVALVTGVSTGSKVAIGV